MRPLALRESPKRGTLRAQRLRLRVLVALLTITLLGAAAYGLSYTSYLPRFSVQDVVVRGAHEVRENLVRAYVGTMLYDGTRSFFSRGNIFFYPRAEIETAVKEYFPRVQSVQISRESLLATAILVSVKEREAFARWCTTNETDFTNESFESCYVMDRSGLLFAPMGASSADLATSYIFRGGLLSTSTPLGQAYLPGAFAGVSALLERLGQAGFTARSVSAEGERDFSIMLAQGFELRASFGSDIGALVKNLELVLSSETLRGKEDQLEYIDLRFGNRVYYKLKGQDQVEQQ